MFVDIGKYNISIFVHTQDGRTALYLAGMKGHVAVVQLLLQRHAGVYIESMKNIFQKCIGM